MTTQTPDPDQVRVRLALARVFHLAQHVGAQAALLDELADATGDPEAIERALAWLGARSLADQVLEELHLVASACGFTSLVDVMHPARPADAAMSRGPRAGTSHARRAARKTR